MPNDAARIKESRNRYTTALAGYIKKKDPKLDEAVKTAFARAEVSISQLGMPPDPASFKRAREELIAAIRKVYTYFDEKK